MPGARRGAAAAAVLPLLLLPLLPLVLLLPGCAGTAPAAPGGPPQPPGHAAQPQPLPGAPDVHVRQGLQEDWGPANLGAVANASFVVGQRCVAVIDSGGSLADGRALKAAIRRATPLPVCYVINTHAHPDHVLGNAAFRAPAGEAEPQFVGHERLPAALASRGPYYLKALQRDFGPMADGAAIVAPTLTVQRALELDLGGRTLQLQAWPTAHTDADLTVFDPASGTLWLGDLLFLGHLPVVDGKLKGWLDVMAALRALPATTAVPGHGAPGRDWPAMLDGQQAYLTRLAEDTRTAIRSGWSLAQAVERIVPDPSLPWRLTDLFHKRNVTAAYAELEWEP